ncbi:MAG TPA: SPOR domain-containing protein, partial [Patescibacteria group bacterium]|nr:SPOR domain-containing protein [Patescibacteria group bacterium]
RVHGANKDTLAGLSSDIVRVDLGAKGIFWRLRAGPVNEAQARTICAQLAKRNQGCIIARK